MGMQGLLDAGILIGSWWANAKSAEIFQITKNYKAAYLFTVTELPEEFRRATDLEILAFETLRKDCWSLVEKYKSMMYTVAQKFPDKNIDADELVYEVGIKTALNCYRRYDPSIAKFSTYLYRSLYFEYTKYIERRKILTLCEELPERAALDRESTKLDNCEEVQLYMNVLTERERSVITDYFWGGKTYEQIGAARGLCKAAIFLQFHRALRKMREAAQPVEGGRSNGDFHFFSEAENPATGEDEK